MGSDTEIRTREAPCRAQLLWRTGVILLFLASAFLSVCRSGNVSHGRAGVSAPIQTVVAADPAAASGLICQETGDGECPRGR